MSTQDRRANLNRYAEDNSYGVPADVRETLTDLVMGVDTASRKADVRVMRALIDLANVCINEFGYFDPDLHMEEAALAVYAESRFRHRPDSSKGTMISSIRRVNRGRRMVRPSQRLRTPAPYLAKEWARLETAAASSGRWTTSAQLLLSLTGHAALSSAEIIWAESATVRSASFGAVITVPAKSGEFREVPVFGVHADRVLTASTVDPSGYLFHPSVRGSSRNSVIKSVGEGAGRQRRDFLAFNASRARNTRVFELLQIPAPWSVIKAFAGTSDKASHYLSDLTLHIERADSSTVFAYMGGLEVTR
ncbi:hypothetical protein ASD11_14935 [Aeromicrobium sp. Root495]|uniref:hypothetical protein n=1 Tax=Aeromicrobium sp. Root495 TaxID=1736550 RepID=UPI000700135D|nr:hypothetical protein [Aeromicrobium sp. Root495]KQY55797.1 hypothetical protein ASD11_14935 [Aeromicrobium sp. Root495]